MLDLIKYRVQPMVLNALKCDEELKTNDTLNIPYNIENMLS